jgi:hypothetical protein
MNHWFTTTAAEYYPDTSHMLLWGTYFGGSGFKKVYRCPMRRRPVSEKVDAKDLIVSDTTKDLRVLRAHHAPDPDAARSVMKRMKLHRRLSRCRADAADPDSRTWSTPRSPASRARARAGPARGSALHALGKPVRARPRRVHSDGIKFKGEGIPLPYLVTIDKDSREILAIRRDWTRTTTECERKRMYVKYPYVPGPGFLRHRDAEHPRQFLGGDDGGVARGARRRDVRQLPGRADCQARQPAEHQRIQPRPGQFKPIETNGAADRQVVMPMPYKDVTAGLMAMMDKITEQSKASAARRHPAGEGMQNVPVGTMLAQIEQATKIMAAAHKGMHQAQSEELELLIDLFRDIRRTSGAATRSARRTTGTREVLRKALENCNLVPVSDPNVPSHIHRHAGGA